MPTSSMVETMVIVDITIMLRKKVEIMIIAKNPQTSKLLPNERRCKGSIFSAITGQF
ncbi:MAG: hypothetical protein KAI17_16315 [Thiotrichaceae bacterium]|nr:hypothetical protein [Thiotrichaceae bacterium]